MAGAGLAGTAIATHLAAAGVTVDLIDVKPAVTALGSGISMQSNALRELRALGVLDQVTEHGYAFSSLGLRAPDPAGTLLVELPDRSDGDLPGSVGIPRPVLARIVLDRAAQAGATIRLATSCAGLRQDTERRRCDVRRRLGRPRTTSWWRPTAFRTMDRRMPGLPPETATDRDEHLAGVRAAAGERHPDRSDLRAARLHRRFCPTGADTLYAYMVEDRRATAARCPRANRCR